MVKLQKNLFFKNKKINLIGYLKLVFFENLTFTSLLNNNLLENVDTLIN
jgi:hypothetical protein